MEKWEVMAIDLREKPSIPEGWEPFAVTISFIWLRRKKGCEG